MNSLALVAPWLHNEALVETVYGGSDSVSKRIAVSREANRTFRATGALSLVPAAGSSGTNAIMQGAAYYTDPDHGAIPEYDNYFKLASWEGWLTFDGIAVAKELSDTPVRIVHSEAAAVPDGARQFYAMLPGQKSQIWLENVTQFDFYDEQSAVTRASNAVAAHFDKTLN